MLNKAFTNYHDVKWLLQRIIAIFGILLGIYLYYHAYYHLNNNISGNVPILMLSGTLFIITGILDFIRKSLTTSIFTLLSAIIALVLYLVH